VFTPAAVPPWACKLVSLVVLAQRRTAWPCSRKLQPLTTTF